MKKRHLEKIVKQKEETVSAEKQPPGVFYEKSCTYKFHKIYGKTSVPEHFLLKKRIWQRCFPVHFANFLRTPRSSHQRCSLKKGVLRNFTKFTGKHLCQSLFFYKVVGLRPATLLKKRLWHRCFSVKFVKFLRTPLLQNTSGRVLLREDIVLIIL